MNRPLSEEEERLVQRMVRRPLTLSEDEVRPERRLAQIRLERGKARGHQRSRREHRAIDGRRD
jgi:hypothetical protein